MDKAQRHSNRKCACISFENHSPYPGVTDHWQVGEVVARASPGHFEKEKYLAAAGKPSAVPRPYCSKPMFVFMPTELSRFQINKCTLQCGYSTWNTGHWGRHIVWLKRGAEAFTLLKLDLEFVLTRYLKHWTLQARGKYQLTVKYWESASE